ncbi:MAG: hypothetical protein JST20_10230 [Bacteroidetes bacterium]|nr:hypothetical protein [Bacteroidota bacterium]
MKLAHKFAAAALCLGLIFAPTLVSTAACKDKTACKKEAVKTDGADCCKKGAMSKKESCCKKDKSMSKAETAPKADSPKQ